MERAVAKRMKQIIGKGYRTTYMFKTGLLRIRVHTYINNDLNPDDRRVCVERAIKLVQESDLQYRTWWIEEKTYEGFIHDTFLIVD